MQAACCASEVRSVLKVRGGDNQRVALPAAAGVSLVLTNVLIEMRRLVQRNDPGLVDHLVVNHDRVGALHDLDIAVVGSTGDPWQTLRDAALPQTAIRPGVAAATALEATGGPQRPKGELHVSLAVSRSRH